MPNYDDLAAALADQGAAFGVFPQMSGRRRLQDAEAAKNIPVDILGGIVSSGLGAIPSGIKLLSDIRNAGRDDRPSAEIPGGIDYWLDKMPFKGEAPVNKAAAQLGSMLPINPAPAYRALGNVGKATTSLLGNELARGMYGNEGSLANVIPTAMKPRFATEPQMQMAQTITKPKAEVSPLGFYSAVEQQALNIPRKQGTGESFLNDLAKGQDVKKYEMEAMGLDEFLKGKPNVTRQEVQDFIANNRINVQEKQLGGTITEDPIGIAKRKAVFDKYEPQMQALYKDIDSFGTPREVSQNADNQLRVLQEMRDAEANAVYTVPESTPTKYDKYQLPGGENYREILLTLPNKPMDAGMAAENYYTQFVKRGGEPEWAQLNPAKQQEITNAMPTQARNASASPDYRSSHFDEPNILAHMRVNDRVDAEGKKMLLIEEVQSDWHQAGREKGYNTPEKRAAEQKKLDDLLIERQQLGERQKQLEELASPYTSQGKDAPRDILNEWNNVSNRLQRLQTEQNRLGRGSSEGVPDAPFKDTWHQLALKRAIKEAVDKGYDRIGLTTGAQQAERYDLSKQVDNLLYSKNPDGTYRVSAQVQGRGQMIGEAIPESKLSDYVGKEVAEKMSKGTGKQTEVAGEYDPASMTSNKKYMTELSGIDLKVGGEGMKKYYDEIYPNYLNKLGKKYGSQVGETNVKTQTGAPAYVDYIVGPGNFNDTTVLGVRSDGTTSIINQNANSMEEAQQLANRYKEKHLGGGQEKVRYLDITPEMRKAIKEGQPLASIEEELAKALA